ncbi:MAG: phosphoribosylanthranilate isomerase [Bacteroidaceae bacterium]|nr:phosphoribosylanthranilate isomerase [Bacteroidaceae bacterium]
MIVKVCGLRDTHNIRAVEEQAAPDWYGFIFYARSPRYVADVPTYLPRGGRRVGVFVKPDTDDVLHRARQFGLHTVQLYGAPPAQCAALREAGLQVIVALSATGDLDALATPYIYNTDYFLFDTPTASYGGSGRQFDHTLLATYTGSVPFLLSGGLGPASLPAVRAVAHPRFAGIDLNSGFETAPARKDAALLADFIKSVRDGALND